MTHLTERATSRRAARAALVSLAGALVVLAAGSPAAAQFPRRPRAAAEPSVWISAGVGLLNVEGITDGRTQTAWDLDGTAAQWRASIDANLTRGISLGLTGGYAQIPTTYVALGVSPAPPISGDAPCLATGSCSATTDVVTVLATARLGGGRGLHQVVELALGVNQYRKFRTDDGSRLAPEQDTDLAGSVGYGLGYGFSELFQVALVQDFGFNAHQRDDLPRGASSLTQQRVTRLSVRFGFAERRSR